MLQIPGCSALNLDAIQVFLVQISQIDIEQQPNLDPLLKQDISDLAKYAESSEELDDPRKLIYDFFLHGTDFFVQTSVSMLHDAFNDLAKTPLFQVLIVLKRYQFLEVDILARLLLFSNELNKLSETFQLLFNHRLLSVDLVRSIINILNRAENENLVDLNCLLSSLHMLGECNFLNADNLQIILRSNLRNYYAFIYYLQGADLLLPNFGQQYLDRFAHPHVLHLIIKTLVILKQSCHDFVNNIKKKIFFLVNIQDYDLFYRIITELHKARLINSASLNSILECKDLKRLDKLIQSLDLPVLSSPEIHSPVPYKPMHVVQLAHWLNRVIVFDSEQTTMLKTHVHRHSIRKIDLDALLDHAIILISLLKTKGHLDSEEHITKLIEFLQSNLVPSQAAYHDFQTKPSFYQNYRFPFEENPSVFDIFNDIAESVKFTVIFCTQQVKKSKLDVLCLMDSLKLPDFYYTKVFATDDPMISAKALEILVSNKYLTPDFETRWLDALLSHKNPISLANAIVALSRVPIISVTVKKTSKKSSMQSIDIQQLIIATQPCVFFEMLTLLFDKQLLKTEHLELARQPNRCSAIVSLLKSSLSPDDCNRALLLLANKENRYQDPVSLVQGLVTLFESGLLTDSFRQNDWDKFCQHLNPVLLADTLISLNALRLTPRERDLYYNLVYKAGPGIVYLTFDPCKEKNQKELMLLTNRNSVFAMYGSRIFFIKGQEKIIIAPKKRQYQVVNILKIFYDLIHRDAVFSLSFENIKLIRQMYTNFPFSSEGSENSDVNVSSFVPLFPCNFVGQVAMLLDPVKSLFHETDSYYFNGIFTHANPLQAAESVALLLNADVKEKELFDKVFEHKNPLGLAKGYLSLKNEQALLLDIYSSMLHYLFLSSDPEACVKAMRTLHAAELFTLLSRVDYNGPENVCNLLEYFLKDSPEYFADIAVFFHKIDQFFIKNSTHQIRQDVLNFCKKKAWYHLQFLQKTLATFGDINGLQIKAIYRLQDMTEKKIDALIEALQLLKKDRHSASYFTKVFVFMLSRSEWETPLNLAIIINQLKSLTWLGMDIKQIFSLFENLSQLLNFRIFEGVIVEFFQVLEAEKQLTKENVSRLSENNTIPSHFISIYHYLDQSHAQGFFKKFLPAILSYNNIRQLDEALQILCKKPFFNEQYLNTLLAIDDLSSDFLQKMDVHALLNQDTFNTWLEHITILKHEEITLLLARIPERSWTPKVLTMIFTACQQPNNPMQAVIDCIRYTVIGEERPTQVGTLLNVRQSTHTASVHCTVSESASLLWARYSKKFQLVTDTQNVIDEIAEAIFALPNGYHFDIAKKSWCRMMANDFCKFKDPASQVTLYQLIALFWIALKDEQIQKSPLNKLDSEKKELPLVMRLLVDALYELQRDGNINAQGQDDLLLEDRLPSCASGSFNKFIEKLVGLHPDVQLIFMTKANAAIKLKHLVEIKAFEYTKEQIFAASNQNTPCAIVLDDDLIESIWPQIKIAVTEDLFSEYGSLYPDGIEGEQFLALVACGLDHSLPAEKLAQLIQMQEQVRAGKKHAHDEDDVDDEPSAKRVYRSSSPAGFFSAPSTLREERGSTSETKPEAQSPQPSASD